MHVIVGITVTIHRCRVGKVYTQNFRLSTIVEENIKKKRNTHTNNIRRSKVSLEKFVPNFAARGWRLDIPPMMRNGEKMIKNNSGESKNQ
jgi:hypothetical protein